MGVFKIDNHLKPNTFDTTSKERWAYSTYFLGQNLMYWLVTSYLMLFYTDYIYLPAGIVSILLLFSKVWDAINDPLFGMIVDKANFKSGKFIPWIRLSTVLLPIATILLFTVSKDTSLSYRIAYVSLTYLIWDTVYTISDVPIFALSIAMTEKVKERSQLINYGRLGATIGGALIALLVAPMIERTGYLMPVLTVAIVCYMTMLPVCKVAKERFCNAENQNHEKMKIKDTVMYIRQNKYLLIIFTALCIHGMFNISMGAYVAKYCLGSLDYLTLITVVSSLPALLSYLLLPKLMKHFDKIVIYRGAFIVNIMIGIMTYYVGYSQLKLFLTFTAIRAFVGGLTGILMFTFAADCVEYGHYKSGIRREGITFSVQTFTAKFTAAISTSLAGVVLIILQYDAQLLAQPTEVIEGFWFFSCWMPIIGSILCLPLLRAYKLKDKDVQIMADVNTGFITREEAEEKLSREY